MTEEWIKVFTTGNPVEAQIVEGMLLDNDVNAVTMNKKDQLNSGAIHIYCQKHQVMAALQLIKKR